MDSKLTPPEAEAIRLVSQERTAWEDATAHVTEKVAYQMRNVVRQCRKNYFGIFDSPVDKSTGRQKTWVPYTEVLVDSVRKNVDMDEKDVNVRALPGGNPRIAFVIRSLLRSTLDEMRFGELLDDLILRLAIDGTAVVRTDEVRGKPVTRIVDLLNFYIDPTARSIADAESVIERVVVPVSEFRRLAKAGKWLNPELPGRKDVPASEAQGGTTPRGDTGFVELYRRVGLAPRMVITGAEADRDDLVPAEVICSVSGGDWTFHAAKQREDNRRKGYQECWYTRVPNRWHGRGVAEKAMPMQAWGNMVANIRIARGLLSQVGLFKVQKGAIPPQKLSRMVANGLVELANLTQLEQMAVQDVPQSAYAEEDRIFNWAQRNTAAYETATGESLPSSTPATNAAIQSRAAQSQFVLVREGIGMFLERLVEEDMLPVVVRNLRLGDVVRLTGSADEIRTLDEQVANVLLYEALSEADASGAFLDPEQVEQERQRLLAQMQASGDERHAVLREKPDWTKYAVDVYFTNEEFDQAVMVDKLFTVVKMLPDPADQRQVVEAALDIMGLPPLRGSGSVVPPGYQPQAAQPAGQLAPEVEGARQVAAANFPA